MTHILQNGVLQIEVDERGAELISVQYNGEEQLWQNPTGEWAGHAPLLFPVCGHFGVQVAGKNYPIRAHGFAKRSLFTLTERGERFLRFTLRSSAETKAVYPYDFVFHAIYTLDGATLSVAYEVENPDDEPLYFSCGGHDSFALQKPIGEYELVFEKQVRLVHYFHDDDGYLTGETQDYGEGTAFALPTDFLQESRTLIFKDVRANEVSLCEKSGKKLATIGFAGFDNLLIWRAENDAAFVCIEPWTNVPDYAGAPDTEFSTKEGVMKVDGKTTKTVTRYIRYGD